jgi:hypothetical protein
MLLKFYRPLQQWLIKRADLIVGTTPVYVQLSPFLQHVQDKIACLPIGIDKLEAEPDKINRIKEQYAGRKIIFSLGRLVEYKGYEYLIEAAKYLDDSYIILIGGEGHLRNTLQQLIDDLQVNDKVELIGFIPDDAIVAAYFMACDLFCLSSIWKTEAFGIVQIEAMSCGKPVVTTNIPESGVNWVNADGVSGYNVEPQNAEALAGAIRKICSDSECYQSISTGALQRYETMFTQEKMVDKCMQLYDSLFEKPLSLPVESFFNEVKTLLAKDKQVRIPVRGRSMRPFLLDGDTAVLSPVCDHTVKWGDIVLASTTTNRIVLHRVVFREKETVWLMGDAHSRQKEQAMKGDIFAFVTTIYNKGKELRMDSFGRRCMVVVWFLLMPLRGVIVRIYDKLIIK